MTRLAVQMVVLAVLVWSYQFPWLLLVCLPTYFWFTMSFSNQAWVAHYLPLDHFGNAVVLLLVSSLAVVGGIVRVLRSNEETTGFSVWGKSAGRRGKSSYQTPLSACEPDWVFRWNCPTDREMVALVRHQTPWQKIRRWRVGLPNIRPIWVLAAVAMVAATVLTWARAQVATDVALIIMYGSTLLPAFISLVTWERAARKMPGDLLRPARRADYVRQMTWAVALTHAKLFLIGQVALSYAALLQAQCPWFGWQLPCVALGINVFVFGLGMWVARYGRVLPIFAGMAAMFGVIVAFGTLVSLRLFQGHLTSTIFIAGFGGMLMIVGLSMVWDAYRRWQRVELGLFA